MLTTRDILSALKAMLKFRDRPGLEARKQAGGAVLQKIKQVTTPTHEWTDADWATDWAARMEKMYSEKGGQLRSLLPLDSAVAQSAFGGKKISRRGFFGLFGKDAQQALERKLTRDDFIKEIRATAESREKYRPRLGNEPPRDLSKLSEEDLVDDWLFDENMDMYETWRDTRMEMDPREKELFRKHGDLLQKVTDVLAKLRGPWQMGP